MTNKQSELKVQTVKEKEAQAIKNGVGYSAASVAISTGFIALVALYAPEVREIQEILIAALTPILNGLLVMLKKKFL